MNSKSVGNASVAKIPRANAARIPQLVNKTATIIGLLDSMNGVDCVFKLSDGTMNVQVGPDDDLIIGNVYQVSGKVVDDQTMKSSVQISLNTSKLPDADFEERFLKMRYADSNHLFQV